MSKAGPQTPINYAAAAAKRSSLPPSSANSAVPTPLASPAPGPPNGKLPNGAKNDVPAVKETPKEQPPAVPPVAATKIDFNSFFQSQPSPDSPTAPATDAVPIPSEPISAPIRRSASTYDPAAAPLSPRLQNAAPPSPGGPNFSPASSTLAGNARAFTPSFQPGQAPAFHPKNSQGYQNGFQHGRPPSNQGQPMNQRGSFSGPSGGRYPNQNAPGSPRPVNGILPGQQGPPSQQGVPYGYYMPNPNWPGPQQAGFAPQYYSNFYGQPIQPPVSGAGPQGARAPAFTPGAPPNAPHLSRAPSSTGPPPSLPPGSSPALGPSPVPAPASVVSSNTLGSPVTSAAPLPPRQGTSTPGPQPGSPFKPSFNPAATEFSPTPSSVSFTPARRHAAIAIRKPPASPTKAPAIAEKKDDEDKNKKAAEDKAIKEAEQKVAADKAVADKEAKATADKAEIERAEQAKEQADKAKKEDDRAAAAAKAAEAQTKAEEAAKAEAEAKAKAEQEAKSKAEDEAKVKAEAEAKQKAEDERLAKEKETKAKEDADAATLKKTEEDQEAKTKETEAIKAAELKPANPAVEQLKTESIAPSIASSASSDLGSRPSSTEPPSDSDADRKKPTALDLSKPTLTRQDSESASPAPFTAALRTAKPLADLKDITYPEGIAGPRPELNAHAQPGKYRYDRAFLLQFEPLCKERPEKLSLEAIGMLGDESSAYTPASGKGQFGRRASGQPLGRTSSLAGSPRMPYAAMGSFSAAPVAKTSNERFAQSNNFQPGFHGMSRPASGRQSSMNAMGGPRVRSQRGSKRGERETRGPAGPVDLQAFQQLQSSENAWVSGVQAGPKQPVDPLSPEMVQRKVKALLNKLTIEKFDSISDQILEWANKSEHEKDGRILRQVLALIFEKATDEAAWSEMYAKLCRKLLDMVSPNVSDETLAASSKTAVSGGSLFRKYLLNRCQEDYERGWSDRQKAANAAAEKATEDQAKKEANDQRATEETEGKESSKEAEILSDEYYAAQKAKRRGLGLVRFIGELFKLHMLTSRIMHDCIVKLLGNVEDPEEDDVESLCRLLTTVGQQLDEDQTKGRQIMPIYFQRLDLIVQNPKVNSRIRYMVLDVIDLRKKGWKSKDPLSSGPKTIAQVHKDAQLASEMESRRIASASSGGRLPKLSDQLSRPGSRRGAARETGPDGWSVAGAATPQPPRPTKAGDMTGFGTFRAPSQSGRERTFGPSSTFSKKASTLSNEKEAVEAPRQNAFAALEMAEGGGDTITEEPHGDAPAAEEAPKAAAPALDAATIDRMVKNLVAEFFQLKKVEEGVQGFEDLPVDARPKLVSALASKAMDAKEAEVKLVALLFSAVADASLVDTAGFTAGLKDIVVELDDLATDVPKAYPFAGQLLQGARFKEEDVKQIGQEMEAEEPEEAQARLLGAFLSAA